MGMTSHKKFAGTAVVLCGAILAFLLCGCGHDAGKEQTKTMTPTRNIDSVMAANVDQLMKIPGVVGVYHGLLDDGTDCIKVMVKKKSKEHESKIPSKLEGFPVVIEETCDIRPLKK